MIPSNPHFLLVGHGGCHNRGCEAIVRTTVGMLTEAFPDARFTVASVYPENDGPLMDIPRLQIIPGCKRASVQIPWASGQPPQQTTWIKLFKKLVKAMLPYGVVEAFRRWRNRREASEIEKKDYSDVAHLRDVMLDADVILSVGGDNYTEDYGPPIYFMELLEFAKLLKRKTVIWGASIGPFSTESIRCRMVELMKATDLIAVRDDSTLAYLNQLGIKDNVIQMADPALLLPAVPSHKTRPPWLDRSSCIVGFNGSGILYAKLGTEGIPKALGALASFFRHLIDERGTRVLLVPHDANAASPYSDYVFLAEFQQAVGRPEMVHLLPPGLNALETKAAIGQCNAFVGMRMHATIASLSQAIPTLTLGYSLKFAGINRAFYGHTQYLVSYGDISETILRDRFEKLQEEDESIRVTLQKRLPELQAQALQGVDGIRALVLTAALSGV